MVNFEKTAIVASPAGVSDLAVCHRADRCSRWGGEIHATVGTFPFVNGMQPGIAKNRRDTSKLNGVAQKLLSKPQPFFHVKRKDEVFFPLVHDFCGKHSAVLHGLPVMLNFLKNDFERVTRLKVV